MRWVIRGPSGNHQVEVERSADGFDVSVDGQSHGVDLICLDGAIASLRFTEDGRSFQVAYQHDGGRRWRVAVGEREFDLSVLTPVEAIDAEAAAAGRGPSRIEAPIPGKVVAVSVSAGDEVSEGQPLVVLEAMKMENELTAEQAGTVAAVHVEPGDTVDTGTVLVELE
jgi:biotin carboxyl carrier protein